MTPQDYSTHANISGPRRIEGKRSAFELVASPHLFLANPLCLYVDLILDEPDVKAVLFANMAFGNDVLNLTNLLWLKTHAILFHFVFPFIECVLHLKKYRWIIWDKHRNSYFCAPTSFDYNLMCL